MSAPPPEDWYFSKNGKQYGPVKFEELKFVAQNGQLHPRQDLVWKASLPEWTPAGDIESLFERVIPSAPQPPPTPEISSSHLYIEEEESVTGLLSKEQNWVGIGRGTWIIGSIVISVLANVASIFGAEWLVKQAEGRQEALLAIPVLLTIAIIMLGVKRLRNTGTNGWWFLGNFVPILHLWVGYRMFACPPGYEFHRKMDGIGIFLAIIYWLFAAASILGGIALILVALGMAGDAEMQKHLNELINEARATAPTTN